MSGIAGLRWHDERRPAGGAAVHPLLATLGHRGDHRAAAAEGPCAVGVVHVSRRQGGGDEPLVRTGSGLLVALDGRIDNGDELRRALAHVRAPLSTDASLIAAAWEAWGEAALPRLEGDFAMAVWAPRTRTLWLARDVFGMRPLFYRSVRDGFWWASELQALARLAPTRVNEGMAGEYLADRVSSETDTLAVGIQRLPRASVLRLDATCCCAVSRYWDPDRVAPRQFATDADAVAEFRCMFREAVRARVRSDRPIALMLSGGLDSSLIAAQIADLERRGESPPLEAFSTSWPAADADESGYARSVAAHLGLRATVLGGAHPPVGDYAADARRALDLPEAPNSRVAHGTREAMRRRGCRVVLNGVGGDEWFGGNHFVIADELRAGRWVSAARRLRQRQCEGYRWASDLRLALWLQLPDGAKQRARRWLDFTVTPPWIQPQFAARVDLEARLRVSPRPAVLPTFSQRQMFGWATNADAMFLTELNERVDAAYGFDIRSPFFDRRLVEWALGLPEEFRRRGTVRKVLLRMAAADVLPRAVVERPRGPDFSFMTAEALHLMGGAPYVLEIARARSEWVNPAGIDALWIEMRHAEAVRHRRLGFSSWVLWLLVATHLAATAIEGAAAQTRELPRQTTWGAATGETTLEPTAVTAGETRT